MKKKLILLSLTLSLIGGVSISNAQIMDQTVYTIPLSSSINLKKVVENYGYGTNEFNIIEADLNDPNNSMDILFNTQGLFKTISIKQVVDSTPNIVAAANTDFFLLQTPTSSIGAMVKNHKVLSSPAESSGKYASMVITDNNKVTFEYLNPNIIIKNITTNKDYTAPTMNKVISNSYRGITVRTSDYAYTTFGKNSSNPNRVEVIVGSDNIVKEIREGKDAVQIPYGGFAIMSFNVDGSELKNNYHVGDQLELTLDILRNRPDIKTIIGGGSVLIKNGQKTPITSSIPGKAQRTAIGITKNNKLIVFTNDGRTQSTLGLDEKDVQNYFYSIGIVDAMIFDGGGSTELYADGKAQNYLYSERKVINAIAIKNEKQTGNVAKVNIVPLKEIIYTGDNVEVIASAQDNNGSKITKYNTPSFTLTTSGFNSQIKDRAITPTTSGKGTINATVQGVTGISEVEVLDSHANDDKYKQNTSEIKKFNVYSNMDDGNDLISQVIKSKMLINSEDAVNNLVIGNNDVYFTSNLRGNSQNINASVPNKIFENTQVVFLNNTVGLYKNESQLNNLKTALNSEYKNIIIAMQGQSKLFNSFEQNMFDKLVESVAKQKNIYVIYKSNTNDAYKRGNVSYISIVDLKNQNYNDLKNVKYLQMYEDINGNLIYNYKSMFN
ncbi:MAG: phosphodiester glycosidase family protein [Peptoanaerobacter stomatis]|uniref:phosphodiester glycosidase family protein n=1 Tax=Peptoanaerobacter stomatis TaxID=796937 RepID=UPI003F9F5B21